MQDKKELKETLTKDIEEIHTLLFNIHNKYMNEETKEEYLVLDKLYHNFLKTKRRLLTMKSIKLNNASDKKGVL